MSRNNDVYFLSSGILIRQVAAGAGRVSVSPTFSSHSTTTAACCLTRRHCTEGGTASVAASLHDAHSENLVFPSHGKQWPAIASRQRFQRNARLSHFGGKQEALAASPAHHVSTTQIASLHPRTCGRYTTRGSARPLSEGETSALKTRLVRISFVGK